MITLPFTVGIPPRSQGNHVPLMERGASPLNGEVGGGDAQSIGDVDLRITDQKLNQFTIFLSLFHSCTFGQLLPFIQWVYDKSRVR